MQRKQRVRCSPLLSVADLQQAFAGALQSIDNHVVEFVRDYSDSTFKTSASRCLELYLLHEQFWAPLLAVLPDAMLPTQKARQALEACHLSASLASESYLAQHGPLSNLVDLVISCVRVQLTKFRDFAVESTKYQSVCRRCTVEQLAALNRLIALASKNLSGRYLDCNTMSSQF